MGLFANDRLFTRITGRVMILMELIATIMKIITAHKKY
jgi:hypothetical protein